MNFVNIFISSKMKLIFPGKASLNIHGTIQSYLKLSFVPDNSKS